MGSLWYQSAQSIWLLVMLMSMMIFSTNGVEDASTRSHDMTIYVSSNGTSDINCGDTLSSPCSTISLGIQRAIHSNHSHYHRYTLMIANGTYYTPDTDEGYDDIINMTMTFQRLNTDDMVIMNLSRSMARWHIESSVVSFHHIIITHASYGWIDSKSSSLTLNGCHVSDIWCASDGGVIFATLSNITIINSSFINCGIVSGASVTGGGGVISIDNVRLYDDITHNDTTTTITSSSSSSYLLTITNSQFINNSITGTQKPSGGCIWMNGDTLGSSIVTITSSLFDGCLVHVDHWQVSATGGGSMTLIGIEEIHISDTIYINNGINYVDDSTITDARTIGGGAILIAGRSPTLITIINCNIINNWIRLNHYHESSALSMGAGIAITVKRPNRPPIQNAIVIHNTSFTGHWIILTSHETEHVSEASGAALSISSTPGSLQFDRDGVVMTSCHFHHNRIYVNDGTGYGAAVSISSYHTLVENCSFNNNSITIDRVGRTCGAAALWWSQAHLQSSAAYVAVPVMITITTSIFDHNTFIVNSIAERPTVTIEIQGSIVINHAGYTMDALLLTLTSTSMINNGIIISSHSGAPTGGGALSVLWLSTSPDTILTMNEMTYLNNSIRATLTTINAPTNIYGGAARLLIGSGVVDIRHSVWTYNHMMMTTEHNLELAGSCLHILYMGNITSSLSLARNQSLTITSCTFEHNWLYGNSGMVSTVAGAVVVNAIRWVYAVMQIMMMDTLWMNNSVTSIAQTQAQGVGSCFQLTAMSASTNLTLRSSSFIDNMINVDCLGDAQTAVGGAYYETTLGVDVIPATTMTNVLFLRNSITTPGADATNSPAGLGGAMMISRGHHPSSFTLLSNVTWIQNSAASAAAIAFQHRGDGILNLTLQSCGMIKNTAVTPSSGLYVVSTGTVGSVRQSAVHIIDTTVDGNIAEGPGGSLCILGVDSIHIVGSSIRNNIATSAPAILASHVNQMTIDSSSIIANEGQAQLFQLTRVGDVTINRSILLANSKGTAVDIDGDRTPFDGINTTWICPIGAPFQWADLEKASHGACTPCGVYSYDLGRRVPYAADDHGYHLDEFMAGDHCYSCPSQGSGVVVCSGGNMVTIATGWQALLATNDNGTQIIPVLPPSGYGCVSTNDSGCLISSSTCAAGRDSKTPYCGSCLTNHSEAFGTNECVPNSQCGSVSSWLILWCMILLSLLYVIIQSYRSLSPSLSSYTVGMIKSFLFFFQSVDIVLPSSSISLSLLRDRLLSLADLRLDATGSSSSACLWPMNGTEKILGGYVLPLIVLSLLMVGSLLTHVCRLCRRRSLLASRRASFSAYIDEDPNNHDNVKRRSCERMTAPDWYVAVITLGLLSYSVIVKSTLSLLRCVPQPLTNSSSSTSSLIMYMSGSVTCYSNWYHYMAFGLSPVIIIFPLIIAYLARYAKPVTTAAKLHAIAHSDPLLHHVHTRYNDYSDTHGIHQYDDTPSPTLVRVSRVLSIAYIPRVWYGEAIQLSRRLLLVTVATFIREAMLRALMLSLILIMYLVWHTSLPSYRDTRVNHIETLLLFLLTCQSVLNVIHMTQLHDGAAGYDHTIEWTQAILVIVPFIIAFFLLLHALYRSCCWSQRHQHQPNDIPSVQRSLSSPTSAAVGIRPVVDVHGIDQHYDAKRT